jgi:hypothetical protein
MTAVEARCEVTELPESMCAHCRPPAPEPPEPRDTSLFGPWFPAGHDGDCDGECGSEIEEGDMIRSDGQGGWLCLVCGADE